jgi:hypothetical protein
LRFTDQARQLQCQTADKFPKSSFTGLIKGRKPSHCRSVKALDCGIFRTGATRVRIFSLLYGFIRGRFFGGFYPRFIYD